MNQTQRTLTEEETESPSGMMLQCQNEYMQCLFFSTPPPTKKAYRHSPEELYYILQGLLNKVYELTLVQEDSKDPQDSLLE